MCIYSVTLKLVIPLTGVVKNDEAITGFKTIMFIMDLLMILVLSDSHEFSEL